MSSSNDVYKHRILQLVENSPLEIETDIELKGRIPTTVSSEFITNKEQGDWAERLVYGAINKSDKYVAVRYGRADSLSAGEEGFKAFYEAYQSELNTIGKLPDLLVFNKSDYYEGIEKTNDGVQKAVCAIEVRSSSFLVEKYNTFMKNRSERATAKIEELRNSIFNNPVLDNLLKEKNPTIYETLKTTKLNDFRNGVTFTFRQLSSSPELRELSDKIKEIKHNIKIIQTRDYLSITPKFEDIALVNRWIQVFNVPHYYLQVFFDKAYIISFEDILKISSEPKNEGVRFSIERDNKNQGKTTVKIDVGITKLVIDEIVMPTHNSQMKELDRGRLLFYVRFDGGEGNLNESVLESVLK